MDSTSVRLICDNRDRVLVGDTFATSVASEAEAKELRKQLRATARANGHTIITHYDKTSGRVVAVLDPDKPLTDDEQERAQVRIKEIVASIIA